jgi:peptide/nickel transport system permease protein
MPSWIRAFVSNSKVGWAARVSAACLVLFGVAALLAPWLSPYPFDAQSLEQGLNGPSAAHWLGQDKLGRDVFSRLLWGARVSLLVGLLSVTVSMAIGVTFGAVSGYLGGWYDTIAMRIIDIFLAFPGILLAIALTAVLGPSLQNIVIALSAFGWVSFARLVRGEILSLREREYVLAARSLGASDARVLTRHLLPGVAAPLVVQCSFALAGAILGEASLSFLGLGSQDMPSWGSMLNEGAEFLGEAAHLSWAPGLALVAVVLSFNLLGDTLRDRFGRG